MNQSDIQAAIFTRLNDQLSTPVYDDVPQNSAFPYIVIGDDTSIPFDDDCGAGFESTITLHVWSIYKGRKEVKDILGSIYNALHLYDLSINNGYTVLCTFDYQETFLDPDGETRHGVIRFRLLTRSN